MFRHGINSVLHRTQPGSRCLGKRFVSRSSAVTKGIVAERRSTRPTRTSHPSFRDDRPPSSFASSTRRRSRDRENVAEDDSRSNDYSLSSRARTPDRQDRRFSTPRSSPDEEFNDSSDPIYGERRRGSFQSSRDREYMPRQFRGMDRDNTDRYDDYGASRRDRGSRPGMSSRDDSRATRGDGYAARAPYRQDPDHSRDDTGVQSSRSQPMRRQMDRRADDRYSRPRPSRDDDADYGRSRPRGDYVSRQSDMSPPETFDRRERREGRRPKPQEDSPALGFCSSDFSKRERVAQHYAESEGYASSSSSLDNYPPPAGIPFTRATSEFLYGANTVLAALKANRRKMYKLYVHPDCREFEELTELAKKASIEVVQVGNAWKPHMDKRSEGRPHNGALLETAPLDIPTLAAISKGKSTDKTTTDAMYLPKRSQKTSPPLRLLLTDILDPQNLGSILRSAYFLGAEMVVLDKRTCAPLNSVAVKASAGAVEALPLAYTNFATKFVADSKSCKWNVFAAHLPPPSSSESTDADNISTDDTKTPSSSMCSITMNKLQPETFTLEKNLKNAQTLMVVGGEGRGLTEKILQQCHGFVNVKPGRDTSVIGLDSLNVGVATALCAAHLLSRIHDARYSASMTQQPQKPADPPKQIDEVRREIKQRRIDRKIEADQQAERIRLEEMAKDSQQATAELPGEVRTDSTAETPLVADAVNAETAIEEKKEQAVSN